VAGAAAPEVLGAFATGIQVFEHREEAMRSVLTRSVCAVAVAVLVNVGPAHAGIIVTNLSEPVNGSGGIYAAGPPQAYAQGFTTGSQSVELGTVIADLGEASGTFTASAELLADNSGLPGSTVLTTFTVPTIPTGSGNFADVTFTPNSNVLLSADTTYWFALFATGTDTSAVYRWAYTNTTQANLPNYAVSNDGGMTWQVGTPPGPFLIQVNSVPEPTSLVLMALAVPAIACGYRAKRKAGLARPASR
jgi:hypothetical protein